MKTTEPQATQGCARAQRASEAVDLMVTQKDLNGLLRLAEECENLAREIEGRVAAR
jgi:hypothetical protein